MSISNAAQAQAQSYERGTAAQFIAAMAPAAAPKTSEALAVVAAVPKYDGAKTYVFQTVVGGTGSLSAVTAIFEGSLDGTNWATLGQSTNTSGEMVWIIDNPTLYVRVRVTTLTAAAGAPTLTVNFAAL